MKQIKGLAAVIAITSIGFLALAIGPAFADSDGEVVAVAAE